MHSVTEKLAKNMLTNYIEQGYNRSYNIFNTSIKSQALNVDGLTTVIILYVCLAHVLWNSVYILDWFFSSSFSEHINSLSSYFIHKLRSYCYILTATLVKYDPQE